MASPSTIPEPITDKAPDLPATEGGKVSVRFHQKEFKLYEASFGEDTDKAIEHWLHESIRVYRERHRPLHSQLLPKWDRLYKGKPREAEKSFPWPNCSNLVVQVIGQEVDDLSARVIGLLYATSPLAIYRYVAKTEDPGKASEKGRLLEQFMDLCGYEPDELDLYPKESRWFSEGAKDGTAFVKAVPEKRVEATVVGYDEQKKKTKMETSELYRGPKVVNVRHDAVMMDVEADTIEDSQLVTIKSSLTRSQMEDRVEAGFYKQAAWEAISGKPDRYGENQEREKELRGKGLTTSQDAVLAEWDIEECWFWWLAAGDGKEKVKFRVIYWYHFETKTVMNRAFNFMPNNTCALVRTRLSTGEKGAYGRGYGDMLEHAQDEVSTIHNQSVDATTAGILGINRIDPSGSNLDRNIQIYPFAVVPMRKDAFEHIQMGNPQMAAISGEKEEMTLRLVHERSGVGPATAGMGAGSVNKKGQYGSMGTLAVMQDGNSRVNHRTSDFRHSHVKLVSLLTKMYGSFGLGKPGSMFGFDDDQLAEALADFLEGRIRIPIRAATASANKEVEKQNLMLLGGWLQGHHKNIIQMLQAIENAAIPPDAKKFFIEVIKSQNRLAKQLLRAFGFDQPDEFVPEATLGQQRPAAAAETANPGGSVADPRKALLQSIVSRAGGGMGGPDGPAGGGSQTPPGGPGAPDASRT